MNVRNPQFLIPLGVAVLGFIAGAFSSTSRPTEELFSGDKPTGTGTRDTVTPKGASEDDPVAAILGELWEPDCLKQFAALSKWTDHLGTSETQDLLDRLRHSRRESDRQLLPAVLAYWASRDPVAATEWIRPYLNDPSRMPNFSPASRLPKFEECIESWAKAAPKHAVELARESPDSDWGRTIFYNAVRKLNAPPAERLKLLASFRADEQRYWRTQEIISEWAQENPAAALDAAKTMLSGRERDASIAAVLKKQFPQNPVEALLQAEALDVQNLPVLGGLLFRVADADPAAAISWLEKHDPAHETTLAYALLTGWLKRDPIASLNWAWQQDLQHESGDSDSGSRKPLLGWDQLRDVLQRNSAATFDWLKQLPAGEKRDELIELAAYATPNAADAIPLLSQLSGEAAANAARDISSRLIDKDPVQAEQWASSLPPGPTRTAAWEGIGKSRSEPLPIPQGPDRDAMLSGMAYQIDSRAEPQKIANWVLEIGDPVLRRRVFEDAMELWAQRPLSGNAQAVREWLQSASVPAEWKEKWLK